MAPFERFWAPPAARTKCFLLSKTPRAKAVLDTSDFIPPQLVQEVVTTAEVTHIHDEWTKMKFATGKYKSTDIYPSPTDPALIKEYQEYLKEHRKK